MHSGTFVGTKIRPSTADPVGHGPAESPTLAHLASALAGEVSATLAALDRLDAAIGPVQPAAMACSDPKAGPPSVHDTLVAALRCATETRLSAERLADRVGG